MKEFVGVAKASPESSMFDAPDRHTPQLQVEVSQAAAEGLQGMRRSCFRVVGMRFKALIGGTVQLSPAAGARAYSYKGRDYQSSCGCGSRTRWHDLPEIPTRLDIRVPGFGLTNLHALMAPLRTPAEVVAHAASGGRLTFAQAGHAR